MAIKGGTIKVGPITPAQFVRQHILHMSAKQLGREIGVSTSIVTRYEKIPERHRKKLIQLARQRKRIIHFTWWDRVPFEAGVPND